jgi:hypothetical protein
VNTVVESAGTFTSGMRDLKFSCDVAEDSRRYIAGELNLPLVSLCLSCKSVLVCDKNVCIVVNCVVMVNKGIVGNVIAM